MAARPLRIATWNIRKAVGTDRRRDPLRILRVIRDLDADLVVLQEADRRLPPRPPALPVDRIREVAGLVPVDPGHDGPGLGAHGNALLARPGIRVETAASLDLPGMEPRGLLAARLATPEGRSFRIVGVHLGLLRASRRRQLRALLDWLDERDDAGLPTIVAGDFNERSRKAGLEALREGFDILPPRNSFHSRLPRWPLDRIAVTADFRTGDPEVVLDRRTRYASDHLPLVADLEWRHPA